MSLRPRSTSITCSARSFSLRFSSSASRWSSSGVRPRGRVPAIGMGHGVPALDPHQHLGGRADDAARPAAHEEHVRRRVDVAEGAIDGERVGANLGLESLRQHHLVDVAGGDVRLGGADRRLVLFLGLVRRQDQRTVLAPGRHRQRPLELLLDKRDLGAGELIQRLEILVAADPRVGDDQDAVLHVVEGQHGVEEHERGVVAGTPRAVGAGGGRLEPGRGLVAEVADCPAGEARQPGHERRLVLRHQRPQRIGVRAVEHRRLAGPFHRHHAAGRAQHQERVLTEERVAADVLAAFDALEQERVVGVLGDLEERRDRGQQVGDNLLAHRHEVAALGEIDELVE